MVIAWNLQSSDEEEGEGEEKKKKRKERKEKKGLKGTLQEKLAGEKEVEKHENFEEKHDDDKYEEKHDDKYEEKHDKYEDTNVPVHVEKHEEEVAHIPAEPAQTEEKKGFLDKIKEKLPGQYTKKGEEVPPPPPPSSTEYGASALPPAHEGEAKEKEKKGILEKIKEKIPGYHPKPEEEKDLKKESASYWVDQYFCV